MERVKASKEGNVARTSNLVARVLKEKDLVFSGWVEREERKYIR